MDVIPRNPTTCLLSNQNQKLDSTFLPINTFLPHLSRGLSQTLTQLKKMAEKKSQSLARNQKYLS